MSTDTKMKLTPAKEGSPVRSLSLTGFTIDEDFSVVGKREKSFTLFGSPIIETFKQYVNREGLEHGDVIEVVAGKHSKGLVVVTSGLCPQEEAIPEHQSLIIRLQNVLSNVTTAGLPNAAVLQIIDEAGLEVAKEALHEYDQKSRLRSLRSISASLIEHVLAEVNNSHE